MEKSATKLNLLGLVKESQAEGLENIRRSRRNARRAATEDLEPYSNDALTKLAQAIDRL